MGPSFNLRLTDELRAKLEDARQEAHRSLNSEIIARLEASFGIVTRRDVGAGKVFRGMDPKPIREKRKP